MRNRSIDNPPSSFSQSNPLKSGSRMVTRAVPVIALLVLAGCASKIDKLPDEAQLTVPEAWQTTPIVVTTEESAASISTDQVSPKDTSAAVENGWLNRFADEDLNNYVDIALRNNPDLWASSAQLKTAIEQVTVTGANLWPNLRAGVSSNRTDRETDGITTEIRTVSGTLEINWEADVWGKLTQRRRAAAYSAQAQAELYNAAELSLVANVSRAWFNLMTNKLQLDLAQQRLESFQNTAKLIEENYERGLRSALDVYLSRTDVQRQIANLSDSKFSYISSLRAFKTLLGEYPSLSMDFEAKLPTLTGPIPAGLPAELLTRRPDVKASQLLYKSEIANAKAANRDRFPTISFTGSIGDSRDEFNQLFDNNNMVMTLIGGIAQPIFQAGALKSREDQAYYQAESAYASLVKTTLNAFQEVENSLTREQTLREQHKAILEAVRLAQGGLDLALDRYQTGIENYTTVLQSQRSLFDSMLSEINIRNALLQNRISIHLALGGDFATQEQRADNQTLPSPTQAQASMESVEESEPATDTE